MASSSGGNTAKTVAGLVIGMGGYALLRFSGVPLPTMLTGLLAMSLAMVIGCPIGLLVGHFLSRDSDVDTIGFRIVGWSILLLWLLPVVGIALSAMTWLFSRRSTDHRALYRWLGLVGGLLALGNAAIGSVWAMNGRSADRCPFAAQEQWPAADVRAYCTAAPIPGGTQHAGNAPMAQKQRATV